MRSAPVLFVLATATLSTAVLVGACGSNVAVPGTGAGGGSTGNTGGQPGTSSTSSASTGTSTNTSTGTTTSSGTTSSGTTASSGTTTSSGGADGGPTCPSNGNACAGCLSEACASLYCSCYGNLACDNLSQCAAACAAGDVTCLQTCLTTYKDGVSAAYLLSNCGNQECMSVCPNNGVTLDACQVCLFTQCVPEMNNCLADPECTPLLACWGGCNGGATCIQNCSTTYAAGVSDAQSVVLCSNASCQGTCP
jgi:hypothetical protein